MDESQITREAVYEAFGFTAEEMADIEAEPGQQSYARAKAEARAEEEAFKDRARAVAQEVSETLTADLAAKHQTST